MDIFARPWWLLALPLAGAAIFFAERTMLHPGRRAVRVGLRSLVALAVTLAAAGLRLPARAARPACVFALDVSRSMGELAGVERACLDAADALPPGTPRAAFAFAAEGRVALRFEDPDEALELGEMASVCGRGGTDVAAGLRGALGLLPPGAPGVIVLVSDGRATRVGTQAAALECRARDVPVYPLAPGEGDLADIRLEALTAPASIERGKPVPLVAVISGTRSGPVEVAARRLPGGVEIGRARVGLVAGGFARALFTDLPPREGVVRYEVEIRALEGGGDAFSENDRAEAAVMVRGVPRVLVVSRGGAAAQLLGEAGRDRFVVKEQKPGELTPSADALAGYVVVILEDVGRNDVGAAAEAALVRYVERGGGILATGGPRAFGAGGWRDGEPLPEVLPVRMAPGPLERTLLVMLVDASGSMAMAGSPGRSKIEDAREAVAAIARSRELGPDDEIALVAFREEARVVLKPLPVREKDAVLGALADLTAEGRTSLAAPLRAGFDVLRASSARKRIALLLSDGEPTVETSREELVRLARRMKTEGFALHVLGTNPSPEHRELLAALAEAGGGTHDFESNWVRLGDAIRRMVLKAAGRYVLGGPVGVGRGEEGSEVLRGLGEFPSLGAVNRTRLGPGARAILLAPGEEPVLALGHVGPGRAAAFTSTLGGRWAGGFGEWQARGRFVSQLLRELIPPPPDEGVSVRAVRESEAGGAPSVEITARDETGRPRNLLDMEIELWPPGGRVETAPRRPERSRAEQVALGTYLARVPPPLLRSGARTLLARVVVKEEDRERELLRAPVTMPPSEELLRTGTDRGRLVRAARASGGRLLAEARELASALESVRTREFRDVAPHAAAVALLLVILELAARAIGGRFTGGRSPRE